MKRSRIRRYNAKRRRRLWEKQYHSQDYLDFIHSQPCIVPGCTGRSEACHTKGKNPGATWKDIYPACRDHHTGSQGEHTLGKDTFMKLHGVDIYAEAARMVELWLSLPSAA